MCGRFGLYTSPETLTALLGELQGEHFPPRFNIAPTMQVLVGRKSPAGQPYLSAVRWGLVPFWAKDPSIGNRLINARAETLADKPAFRTAFRRRRCVVPADCFYEWRKTAAGKQPYAIRMRDEVPMLFAGLWETWRMGDGEFLESCTIVTTAANADLQWIHNRMPVLLDSRDVTTWLGEDGDSSISQLKDLLVPYPTDRVTCAPVSTYVNNPGNDGPECLVRAGEL